MVELVNDLLSAPDRERRDDDLATVIQRFRDVLAKLQVCIALHIVQAVAIGGFHLKVVHILNRLGVAQDGVAAAPDVAAEQIAILATALVNIEDHLS